MTRVGAFHTLTAGAGSPTVVLEAGLGSTSAQWAWIQPGIASFARVLAYDRAGVGASQAATGPRDAAHIAEELKTLLETAGEPPPYVLVGHSLGGIYARVFAGRFPQLVTSLLLIDPTPLDLQLGWFARLSASLMIETLPILHRLGVQPMRVQMEPLGRDLPAEAREALTAAYASLRHLQGFRDEYRAMAISSEQARRARLSPDLPVTVLSAGLAMAPSQEAMVELAQAEHARFAASFRLGRHRVIAGANHLSLVTDPNSAAQIVEEIGRLADLSRPGDGQNSTSSSST